MNRSNFWVYEPNAEIRLTAVYGFPTPKELPQEEFRIEFDCRFQTNRFGLQGAEEDYDPGGYRKLASCLRAKLDELSASLQ